MKELKNRISYKLALSGVLIALGVVMSAFYIPVGAAKCFPIQHLLNVVGAVLLGPLYTIANAFIISLIRNMTGLGSLLAFPGSMIGASLAGISYYWFKNHRIAAIFEFLGTGIIGGVIASPFASLFMGKDFGLLVFVLPFAVSSLVGSLMAMALFESTALLKIVMKQKRSST